MDAYYADLSIGIRGMEDIFHHLLSVFASFTIMGIDFLLSKNEWLFIHF
ncbi:hypothetical protein QKW52_01335 [Bacillus sonorensis]|nr:hypothetical protein [Bacillus sonorensis]